jgi:hypothetical protein
MAGPGDLALAFAATPVKTAAYAAQPGDFVRTDASAGPVAVALPYNPPAGTQVGVKQVATAGGNTTTVTCSGSDSYNRYGGGTSLTLTLAGQGTVLQYGAGIWLVKSDDLPLAQLDLRYPPLDTAAADIADLGAQAAGSVGKPADAGHVHPRRGYRTMSQQAKYAAVTGQGPRETVPFHDAANNLSPLTSGVMQTAVLPVFPGDQITNLGFVTGSTPAVFGTSGWHWWTALYDATGANLIGQSADQLNAALSAGAAKPLALVAASGFTIPYVVPAGVFALLAGVMINVGTGGSPAMPSLRGVTLNAAQTDSATSLFPTSLVYAATSGSSLGATAPAAPLTLTASGNLVYLGAN